jgi:hypothetical protein
VGAPHPQSERARDRYARPRGAGRSRPACPGGARPWKR